MMFRTILSFASIVTIDIFFHRVEGTIMYFMFRIRNQIRTDMGIRSPCVNHPDDLSAGIMFVHPLIATCPLQIKLSRTRTNAPMSNETAREDAT